MSVRVIVGDCLESLRGMEAESVQCCVTSPPYFGLRDYGHPGQLGLESTPELYVSKMVEVFREVRRVLRNDGTLWLNIGDSYAGVGAQWGGTKSIQSGHARAMHKDGYRNPATLGCKPKDLIGIPWMLAFALRADGWYLRSDIIWHKPNPMPESVTDRPTKSHEYLLLLSKSERYYYDHLAIREGEQVYTRKGTTNGHHLTKQEGYKGIAGGTLKRDPDEAYGFARDITTVGRNARTVWSISTTPYSGAHFATMPPELAERCIKAGSKTGDTVLDPFGGAGTTGLVADRLNRNAILCELNPEYADLARKRIQSDNPLFTDVA